MFALLASRVSPLMARRAVAAPVYLCIAALGVNVRFCRCGRWVSVGGESRPCLLRRNLPQLTRRTVAPARMACGISATWSTTSSR